MAVEPGRAGKEDPVVLPQPVPQADEGTGIGTKGGPHPIQPRARHSGQQGAQDHRQGGQAALPALHAASAAGAGLTGSVGPGDVAGAHHQRGLDLVERGIAPSAHVVGEDPVVAVATLACHDEDEAESAVKPSGSSTIGYHPDVALGAQDAWHRAPVERVLVAAETGNG